MTSVNLMACVLMGMGNIARRIAYIMGTGFRCKVLGYDPFVSAEEEAKRGFEKVDTVEELLERSDLVNVNVPLVKSTRSMTRWRRAASAPPRATPSLRSRSARTTSC